MKKHHQNIKRIVSKSKAKASQAPAAIHQVQDSQDQKIQIQIPALINLRQVPKRQLV